MIRWLLRYDPPKALVDQVAAVFTRTKGDIKAVVREIMKPANLAATPMKYKRPFHLVASALRATNATVSGVAGYAGRQLTLTGQPILQWDTPDGFPDSVEYWAGNGAQLSPTVERLVGNAAKAQAAPAA